MPAALSPNFDGRFPDRAHAAFFHRLGRIAKRHRASLYYPAAGNDVQSFLVTAIPRAVFLDPRYFRSAHRSLTRPRLRQILRQIDPQARFDDRGPRRMAAVLRVGHQRRRILFVQANAGDAENLLRRTLGGKFVYLAKGSLRPEVLIPDAVSDARSVAFALDLADLPPYTRTIRRFFRGKRFEVSRRYGRLLIFARYTASAARAAKARREFAELLRRF